MPPVNALQLLESMNESHEMKNSCTCTMCTAIRSELKCTHPHNCINTMAKLMDNILPRWDPRNDEGTTETAQRTPNLNLEEGEIIINKPTQTTSLREAITIFNKTNPNPSAIPEQQTNTTEEAQTQNTVTVYTDRACVNNGLENAAAGSRVWYGDNDPRNSSTRVALENQSNQTGKLMAILIAIKNNPSETNLRIISDSEYAIDGLTKYAKEWEAHNWLGNQNGDLFKCITAWTRSRKGTTTLKWTKGHNGVKGNEEADKLAGEGAKKPLTIRADTLQFPHDLTAQGATLAKLKQKDLYKTISEKKHIPTRSRAEKMIGRIQACAKATFDSPPRAKAVWTATRHKDFTRKMRDFLWKSTQHAYKIGEYWTNIPGYEGRGICPLCDKQEDMEHILSTCKSTAKSTAWKLANELWLKRNDSPLPSNIGDILGCSLANFSANGKPNTGKNHLYRIIVSETAFLIWKLRNKRWIRDEDSREHHNIVAETTSRWVNVINKRLTIDRHLTNKIRFAKRALNEKLVKRTWKGCLNNKEYLPNDWHRRWGVLVGISRSPPQGSEIRGSPPDARSPTQGRQAASV